MHQKQKGFAPIIIIGIVVLGLAIVGGTGYFYLAKQKINNNSQNQQLQDNQNQNNNQTQQEQTLPIEKIDGECGSAINDYTGPAPYEGTPVPKENLCKAGIPSAVASEGWTHFTWWCKGTNGGDDQYCDTYYPGNNDGTKEVVDGECGPATKLEFPLSSEDFLDNRLCEHGIPSSINDNSWKCYGVNGGGKGVTCNVNVPNNQEIKNYFRATEIVKFNILDSYNIVFWAEANCPYSGKGYEYQIPTGYGLGSCKGGEIGSHGGCLTCAMSEINLIVGRVDPNVLFSSNTKISNKLLRKSYNNYSNIEVQKMDITDDIFNDDQKLEKYFNKDFVEDVYPFGRIGRIKDKINGKEVAFLSYGMGVGGGNSSGGIIAIYKKEGNYYSFKSSDQLGGDLIFERINDAYLLGRSETGCCTGCVETQGTTTLFIFEGGEIFYYDLSPSHSEGPNSYDISSIFSINNEGNYLTETRVLKYYEADGICERKNGLATITNITKVYNYKYNSNDNSFELQ